jgi:hypothetical protein
MFVALAAKNSLFSRNSPSSACFGTAESPAFGADPRAASAPIVVLSAPKRYKYLMAGQFVARHLGTDRGNRSF